MYKSKIENWYKRFKDTDKKKKSSRCQDHRAPTTKAKKRGGDNPYTSKKPNKNTKIYVLILKIK